MAARFVVAVALLALCRANSIGVIYRDGRGIAIGQAYNSDGGVSQANANVNGGVSQAYGSSTNGGHIGRDGFFYPGQSSAKAETYDNAGNLVYVPSQAIAKAQNGGAYYTVPAPGAVITYEQNFAVPAEAAYQIPAEAAYQIPAGAVKSHSAATSDGISDSSISTVSTNGAGNAQSSSQTQGHAGFGATSTNAKTYGNSFGSAVSNSKNGFGSAVTSAKTNGFGAATSNAQTNGVAGIIPTPIEPITDLESAVISAKTQGIYTGYTNLAQPLGSASSNANVNGHGTASSYARTHDQRGIHWRFGTLYDNPASTAYTGQPGYGALKYTATNPGFGSANANANVNSAGFGSANSAANTNGFGTAKSSANSNGAGFGSANANADLNNSGYYNLRYTGTPSDFGSAVSSANTGGFGSAKSSANTQGSSYGGRTSSDAQTSGFGSAKSTAKTQGVSTAFKVADSSANSYGHGSANAKATSV